MIQKLFSSAKLTDLAVVSMTFFYLFNIYLFFRQYKMILKKYKGPLKEIVSEEEYYKSCSYQGDKCIFSMVYLGITIFKNLLIIKNMEEIFNFFIYYNKFNLNKDVFALVCLYNLFFFLEIPFTLFSDFYIEEKHNFNKKTVYIFFMDHLKIFTIMNIVIYVFLWGFFIIINVFKDNYLILYALSASIQLLSVYIFPVFIMPLFNKFTELEKDSLKEKINTLAKDLNFDISKILVMDNSIRNSHSNAFFIGFGKIKKVVFFDSLLKTVGEDQIIAILCHEFGHYFYNHIIKLMFMNSGVGFCYFFLFSKINFNIYSKRTGVLLFIYACNLIDLVTTLVFNFISRKFENQADAFAVEKDKGESLIEGLKVLASTNSCSFYSDKLYSCFFNTHPTLLERIENMKNLIKIKKSKEI